MCGSEGQMFKAEIEGSLLTVCKNCSRYGKILKEIRPEKPPAKKKEIQKKEILFVIVDDFAEIIKKKRESLSIKQEDFAKMINEKVSLLHNIETGRYKPSLNLARKLEKRLGIKLIEQHEETHKQSSSQKDEGFTIGDFIKIK